MYIVLVLLFKDFLQPVTILAALPLSMGRCVCGAAGYSQQFLDAVADRFAGADGDLATKNSILLVEYAIVARRDHGMNSFDALPVITRAPDSDDHYRNGADVADCDGLWRGSKFPLADGHGG